MDVKAIDAKLRHIQYSIDSIADKVSNHDKDLCMLLKAQILNMGFVRQELWGMEEIDGH